MSTQKLKLITEPNLGMQVSDGLHAANVVMSNLTTTNGVIHVIDKVLNPATTPTRTFTKVGLTAFAQSVEHHQLAAELDDLPAVTIFAPYNEAYSIGMVQ